MHLAHSLGICRRDWRGADGLAITAPTVFWPLDEASGSRASTIGGVTLTDNNTVTGNPGKVGTAAQFTAANSEYLSAASASALQMGDANFTLAAWAYLDAKGGGDRTLFSKYAAFGTGEFILRWGASPDRFVFTLVNDGGSVSVTDGGAAPALSTWHCVLAWYDAAADLAWIRVNNGTAVSAALAGGARVGSDPFEMGRIGAAGGVQYWDGRLDCASIWKGTILTPTEQGLYYNAGAGSSFNGTVWSP